MALKDELLTLINELNRIHSDSMTWKEERTIPDFVTATNGMQCHFTSAANKALRIFSKNLHLNRSTGYPKIELENYRKIVQQSVVDMYMEGKFDDFCQSDGKAAISKLKELIEEQVRLVSNEYTHSFPAWTLGMERTSPFKIGPVSFLSRTDWIDSVDFPENAKEHYLNSPDVNQQWKVILKQALKNPADKSPIDGLAGQVYNAIAECPSLLKVTIRGYEKEYSRKLAKLVCKTALDAVSLCFGDSQFFYQQALQGERLPPSGSYSLVETNGFLWLPGISLSKRIPMLVGKKVNQEIAKMEIILSALASILESLVNPTTHSYPKLANRWATALDWFAEAHRESSDAIAVAKFGTSLDVLAAGGKFAGILDLVTNLTGVEHDVEVVKEPSPLTLKKLVQEIYDDGRSKILHGTHYDRLVPFDIERNRAAFLARISLVESALRLTQYSGKDDDKAFRKMPPISSN